MRRIGIFAIPSYDIGPQRVAGIINWPSQDCSTPPGMPVTIQQKTRDPVQRRFLSIRAAAIPLAWNDPPRLGRVGRGNLEFELGRDRRRSGRSPMLLRKRKNRSDEKGSGKKAGGEHKLPPLHRL